jgi:hypothetical protein
VQQQQQQQVFIPTLTLQNREREKQTIFLSPNSSIEKVQSYPFNIVKRFSVNPFVFVFVFPLS